MKRAFVVCESRSGSTLAVARKIARSCDADLEVIKDERQRATKALADLESLCVRRPLARLAATVSQVRRGDLVAPFEQLVRRLRPDRGATTVSDASLDASAGQ